MNDDAGKPADADEVSEDERREADQPQEEPGSEARIRAVRRDPLSGARAKEDAGAAAHAYESFQRNVAAAGPIGVVGPAIGNQFHFYSFGAESRSRRAASGPVRAEELLAISNWYAPAPFDPEIRSALTRDHLVVLAGVAGCGRTTTALQLLAEFAPGKVHKLSSRLQVAELDEERIAPEHGYIGELSSGSHGLTEADLDEFANRLRNRRAYCILIPAVEDIDEFEGHYLHTHSAPALPAVFERRVEFFEAKARQEEDGEGAETLLRLAADPEFMELLGPGAEPSDEVALAEVLIDVAMGSKERDEALRNGGWLLDRQIGTWLARLPEGEDLQRHRSEVEAFAFRVALAVLNDSPINMVWEAAARLAWELYTTADPRFTPGRAVFTPLEESSLMRQARARVRAGSVTVADASVPAQLLAFEHPSMGVKLLAAVWNGRPNLRRPVLRWLQDLSQDRRPDLWMRAALAIGLITSWDFAFLYHEAMEQWVNSLRLKQQLVAAIALDQAARYPHTQSAVNGLLNQWVDAGGREQLSTAALVLQYETGARDIASALRMLRRIGLWQDGALANLAANSVAELFARGRFDEVLAAIDAWTGDSRLDHHVLGLSCSVRLALLRVRDLSSVDDLALEETDRQWLAHPDRAGWPLFVALARVSARLGRRVADSVWQALAGSLAASVMRDEIAGWIRAAESAPGLLGPLSDFLEKLIDDADDEARLLDVVAMLVSDPDEPLSAETAAAIRAAVTRRATLVRQLAEVGG